MRLRLAAIMMILFGSYGCMSTAPRPPQAEVLHGVASWYGQEFAGRTTANGEIFDPLLMTAAHRTLPFGTVVDVTNAKLSQSVRVRINDRGPYIGNRLIDLSYAAAKVIGLIEPGSGEVDIAIVKLGSGEREPPAPYLVTVAGAKEKTVIAAGEPPKIDFPLPTAVDAPNDFGVVVESRKKVSADGKSLEYVPLTPPPAPQPVPVAVAPVAAPPPLAAPSASASKFVVQVGAFSVEANAKSLQERLTRIGHRSYIDFAQLFRVRIGPFATRDLAVRERASLEATGISAIVMAE